MSWQLTRRAIGIAIMAGAAGLPTAPPAAADMVVKRWGVGGHVQHPKTLLYEVHPDGGTIMRFDLSALPEKAKVYRARLLVTRPGRYGSRFEIAPVQRVGEGKERTFKELRAEVPLVDPHWRWFDAAGAVREWAQDGRKGPFMLLLKAAPSFDRKTACLEIAYEGKVSGAPRPVTDVKAFYRSGQVFVTFKEIEDFAGGKEEITWGELAKRFRDISYEGPVPTDDDGELRYRIYRHDKPITAAGIAEAELVGEVVPGSMYNTRLVPGGDFIKKRPKAVARRLAVEPGKPLPPGSGVFVHTCRHHGTFHYAVVSTLNGVENTVQLSEANVAGPVEQRRADPEPVLQVEELTDLRGRGTYHKQWYAYWAVPPTCPRPTRYDVVVGFTPETMTHPAPLVFTRGHTWGTGPELRGRGGGRGIGMSMNTEPNNGYWTGVNDARDTLKGIREGAWKPFTHNRQEALIRWAQQRWEIDEQRIVGSIGAWGMWEIKRADLYCYIHGWGMPEVTKGFLCWNWARGAWGPPEAYEGKPDEANPWVQQDYSRWVREHPEQELPYFQIHTGWGAHFSEMGWPPYPRFIRAMIDTRRAFCMQSRAVGDAIRAGHITFRRDASVPAFGNCSLDDNIGEGDIRAGRAFGQINGYLVWESDTIVDEPGTYGITVWLWGGDSHGRNAAPLDACTVDLTPRKCQRFKARAGDAFVWSNVNLTTGEQVEAGQVAAEAVSDKPVKKPEAAKDEKDKKAEQVVPDGLVTLRKLKITKDKHRIVIRRK